MDASALIPAADTIPAAPWFFRILLDATFAVHLLLMNAMLGLCMVGLVRSLKRSSPRAKALGQQAGMVPGLTALTVNIGVAPLLFVQVLYGQFLYVSNTLMAVWWFGISLVVMAAYALAYRQKYALHKGQDTGTVVWALMCLLLLAVSLAQTQNALLLVRPDLWSGYFDQPDGRLLPWGDPTLWPRWLHFVTAAAAIGGLTLAMIGHRRTKHHDPHGAHLTAEGLQWFAWATVAQFAWGVWWLMALPRPLLLAFMGGDALATGLLLAGMAGALAAVLLAFKGRLMATAAAAVATVGIMTALRGVLRQLYLQPYFDPATLPLRPEPSTVVMFLSCVALSLIVVIWAARHPMVDKKGRA
ncbi:hypothetical protein [Megalodesulfovibrio gigas]|uniref:Uncharacterized protein n=1 Tax=Megalodesulfovibrio gigas (strain ATCC 19364 / DSM 1382 / NCIMB 9332 / VKM B-1759) TaxID=1121448 RepID=T2GGI9_MEGG1|nr:hypothetical protein [Megalodesulfovibrio gigas]AGW15262.1 hypothetical protein DGI_4050 [Megalodesulfovibrio gigas DSM 1382 = ATCC 19364]